MIFHEGGEQLRKEEERSCIHLAAMEVTGAALQFLKHYQHSIVIIASKLTRISFEIAK